MTQNRFLMFLIGSIFGLFVAFIPLSIALYATQTGYHLAHYIVLAVSSLFFGGLAVVQKEQFGDTIERVLNSITSG
jgi:nucleoside recognition membrane protein YjiH